MADLEEVLSEMDYTDYIHDSIQFIIDKNLRTIPVPSNGSVLGVTGDNNVNRVNFKMERYYDGNDLSEFTIRISYKNANGDSNFYDVTDNVIEGDYILFTWLVSSDVVANAGTVHFAVRLFVMDNTDPTKIVKSFNTSIVTANVIQGMYVSDGMSQEDQHDIITQLLSMIEIPEAGGGVGQNVKGKTWSVNGGTYYGNSGDEIFNDYVNNIAAAGYSHAEGYMTKALNSYSHAEGYNTIASGAYTHAEGYQTVASDNSAHAEGDSTTASSDWAHAEGYKTVAGGQASHAEGRHTHAVGDYSHAEGYGGNALPIEVNYSTPNADVLTAWNTTKFSLAKNEASHSEGKQCIAIGYYSHAEGYRTKATGDGSHSEGQTTTASGSYSHAEGSSAKAEGSYSHAEGNYTVASGNASHSEGENATASGQDAHAEGYYTTASGHQSHAEGYYSQATNSYSHAEGYKTESKGYATHSEGYKTIAANVQGQHAMGTYNVEDTAGKYAFIIGNGDADDNRSNAFAIDWDGKIYVGDATEGVDVATLGGSGGVGQNTEGVSYIDDKIETIGEASDEIFNDYVNNKAYGTYAHAEGTNTKASGTASHAEGKKTIAVNNYDHAEGYNTKASGTSSHAEGDSTKASGFYSHAEGLKSTASGNSAHAEGYSTTASGVQSHAEGKNTTASGAQSHSEGEYTTASGVQSHAEGCYTKAASDYQHAQGKYNVEDTTGKYAFIIGNGDADANRSNAFAIDWDGKIYVNNATEGVDVAALLGRVAELEAKVAALEGSTS
jgi:hypothetical protein